MCWICDHPGATERDYTEHMRRLITPGMGPARAPTVLNGMAAPLVHAEEPEPGTQAVLRDGPLVEIVRVAVPWAHLNLAVELYGDQIRGLQLVHADKRGNWPWDRRYQGVRGGQPILGDREPAERRKRVG